MSDTRQLCTFRLGRQTYGVPVEWVQEVSKYEELTPVPLAPAMVEGLLNLRGRIVTAIDVRQRLDLPRRPDGVRPMHIVLRTDGVSLVVDEIGDVVTVSDDRFEEPPSTVQGRAQDVILGAYKMEENLLLLLDPTGLSRDPMLREGSPVHSSPGDAAGR